MDDQIVFHKVTEDLEMAARKLGLYSVKSEAERREVVPGRKAPVIALTFLIGDEAFSDRVQNPERYSDEAVMESIEHATLNSEAADILERFLGEGKLFDDEGD